MKFKIIVNLNQDIFKQGHHGNYLCSVLFSALFRAKKKTSYLHISGKKWNSLPKCGLIKANRNVRKYVESLVRGHKIIKTLSKATIIYLWKWLFLSCLKDEPIRVYLNFHTLIKVKSRVGCVTLRPFVHEGKLEH